MMTKTNVHVIEVVSDGELRKKQTRANKVSKRFFPDAGALRLYRTAEGEIGIQVDLDFNMASVIGWIRPVTKSRRFWLIKNS